MTDNKYSDFDAFMQESDATTSNVTTTVDGFEYAGEKYTLPKELLAKTVLRFMRKVKTDELNAVDTFLNNMLGEEQYEKLLDSDIGLPKLMRLIEWIINQYNPQQTNPNVKRGKNSQNR